MKKLLLVVLFLIPSLAFAQNVSFQNNLSYGSTGPDVSALQEFLVTQHVLGPQYVTGNFYSLTLTAVKAFQTAESISPVSGYFGPISRETANTILASEVPVSEGNAATTTEPVDLSQNNIPQPQYTYTPPQTLITQPVLQTTPAVQVPLRTPPVLTVANTGASQTLTAGSIGVIFASIQLAVSKGDEDVMISSIPLVLTLGNGAQPNDLSKCYLTDGTTIFNAGTHIINPTSSGRILFYLDTSLMVDENTVFTLNLICTLSPTAVDGSTYQWTVDSTSTGWNMGIKWYDAIVNSFQGQGSLTKVSNPLQAQSAAQTAQFNQNQDCINSHLNPAMDKSESMEMAILACQ